jgi:hypothetical protein
MSSPTDERYDADKYVYDFNRNRVIVVFKSQTDNNYLAIVHAKKEELPGDKMFWFRLSYPEHNYLYDYTKCERYENISLPIPRLWTEENLSYDANTNEFGVLQKHPDAKNARRKK